MLLLSMPTVMNPPPDHGMLTADMLDTEPSGESGE